MPLVRPRPDLATMTFAKLSARLSAAGSGQIVSAKPFPRVFLFLIASRASEPGNTWREKVGKISGRAECMQVNGRSGS